MVGRTRCYLWLKQSRSISLQATWSSHLGVEQSGSAWKATRYSLNRYPATSQTMANWKKVTLRVVLQRCCTNRSNAGIWHSVIVSSGRGPTPANTIIYVQYVQISTYTWSVKLEDNGIWGWGIYGSNEWDSYGKVSYCFLGDAQTPPLQKKTGDYPFQSLHHGFRSLWTPNLLQKGWDHFPPKACFKWRAQLSVGIHRAMSILITKQIGGGSQWVELVIVKGTSELIVVDLLLSRLGGASGRFVRR